MEILLDTLPRSEQLTYRLRRLYEAYGYRMFRMSKFEEYDFYTENKDFLADGQIITFSDLSGKLLALKPDITLSIVKNTRATPRQAEKVYYTESVYRVSRDVREFKETFQIGLEYIGSVTPYVDVELVTLAAKSLCAVSEDCVLDVSHMGFLFALLDGLNLPAQAKSELLACIEAKSPHELRRAAEKFGIAEADCARLLALTRLSGGFAETLPALKALVEGEAAAAAYDELAALCAALAGTTIAEKIRLDFSLTNDAKYYNGLMLRGYVQGVPRAVLFGGRYDPLLRRMGKGTLQAIGFALAFDEIERFLKEAPPAPFDTAVLYDASSDLALLAQTVEALVQSGARVCAVKELPDCPCRLLRVAGNQVWEENETC